MQEQSDTDVASAAFDGHREQERAVVLNEQRHFPENERRMMQGREKLMVVDDDQMMLDFTERMVISLGYTCAVAKDAASALHRLKEDPDIRGAIVDLRLGKGPSGAQLVLEALGTWPDLGVLLTSGDPASLFKAQQELPKSVATLRKPYRRRDLAASLTAVLSQSQQRKLH